MSILCLDLLYTNYIDPYRRNVRPFVVFCKVDTITYELYVFDSIQYSKKETFNFESIIEQIASQHSNYKLQ